MGSVHQRKDGWIQKRKRDKRKKEKCHWSVCTNGGYAEQHGHKFDVSVKSNTQNIIQIYYLNTIIFVY